MGSSNSKHTRRLEQISFKLDEIKDKIKKEQTAMSSDKQIRYEEILENYKREVESLRKRIKNKSKIRKVEDQISNISEQLKSQKKLKRKEANSQQNLSVIDEPKTRKVEEQTRNVLEQSQKKPKREEETSQENLSLTDIQNKLEKIKKNINHAEIHKNKTHLLSIQKSINDLMTNLQMIDTKNNLLNEEKKSYLEKNLVRLYKQTNKIKIQIEQENKIQTVTDEEIRHLLHNLEEIEAKITKIRSEVKPENLESSKNIISNFKNELDTIEEIDEKIRNKKSEIFDSILNLESVFIKLETEAKLRQIEEELSQDTENTNFHKLKEESIQILEVSKEIENRKKIILETIDKKLEITSEDTRENIKETENEDKTTQAVFKEVEEKLKEIGPKVSNFTGSENSDTFFHLDDSLIQITLKLDCLKLEKGSIEHQKKLSLLREINKLNDTLDERAGN